MSALAELEQGLAARNGKRAAGSASRPPAKTFDLTPDHFADDYGARPVAPIKIGLRIPAEADARTIEDAAMREAQQVDGDSSEQFEAYQRAVQCYWVARCICDPRDVTSGHPFFEMPEDLIPIALKPTAIQRIRQEIELLQVEQSPLHPEADDEEIAELSDLLATEGRFAEVSDSAERQARRYLKFALEIIRNE